MKKTLVPFDVWERSSWCGQEVAGEQYYAKGWRPLLPPSLPSQGVELMERALLVREPQNRHDRNAVRVEIRDRHVGHLPAEDAERYRSILDHLAARGFAARTQARIWAAPEIEYQYDQRGNMREVDTGRVNCRISLGLPEPHLLIPLNRPPIEPHAMLPMGGSAMVKTDGVPITVFEPVLNDAGEGWAHATLHEIHEQLARSTRDLVEVRINGQRAGQMTPAMSKKFLPIIQTLSAQGRLCATPAIVRGNRLQVEVRVCGAQASNLPQEWLLEHANNALARQILPDEGARSPASGPTTMSVLSTADRTPPRAAAATVETSPTQEEANSTNAPLAPVPGEAGWFADPEGVAPLRYWDGMAWTSRIRMR